MSTPASQPLMVGPDTLISVRISLQGITRRYKMSLSELTPDVLPGKLRTLLGIPADREVLFERYSDSAAAYVALDPNGSSASYKTLHRAAKAKLKLRLKATVPAGDGDNDAVPFVLKKHVEAPAQIPLFDCVPAPAAPPPTSPSASTAEAEAAPVGATPPALGTPEAEVQQQQEPTPPKERSVMEQLPNGDVRIAVEDLPKVNMHVLRNLLRSHSEQLPVQLPPRVTAQSTWSVFCNVCDTPMINDHFHCNTCDNGDYDLCLECVAKGKHCLVDSHWLVKRRIVDGKVVWNFSEKLRSRSLVQHEMPGAFTEDKKPEPEEQRTCNCCVTAYPESHMFFCADCADYDLCTRCFEENEHGHHPGHTFQAVRMEGEMAGALKSLCTPGRGVHHPATCDGCDKTICGVRHKCLNCPDWDYCSKCIKDAAKTHPKHRFAPLYEEIAEPPYNTVRHNNVYCDGPLCKTGNKTILGVRYRCAICHDTDFCANCEASPQNFHNRTHPLIMLKTPVANFSVTTIDDTKELIREMHPYRSNNTTSPTRTIAEIQPTEPKAVSEKIRVSDLLQKPASEKIKIKDLVHPVDTPVPGSEGLQASFVRDTIADGTAMTVGQQFVQVWTLRNPGPLPWPAGCRVRYIGGDSMLNIDMNQNTHADISAAAQSNIIERPVEAGEEISFRVAMKADGREGLQISYWRLKTPDGVPFGHRLWCHITVAKPAAGTAPTAETTPAPELLNNMLHRREQLEDRMARLNRNLVDNHRRWCEQSTAKREARLAERTEAMARARMLHNLHSTMPPELVSEHTRRMQAHRKMALRGHAKPTDDQESEVGSSFVPPSGCQRRQNHGELSKARHASTLDALDSAREKALAARSAMTATMEAEQREGRVADMREMQNQVREKMAEAHMREVARAARMEALRMAASLPTPPKWAAREQQKMDTKEAAIAPTLVGYHPTEMANNAPTQAEAPQVAEATNEVKLVEKAADVPAPVVAPVAELAAPAPAPAPAPAAMAAVAAAAAAITAEAAAAMAAAAEAAVANAAPAAAPVAELAAPAEEMKNEAERSVPPTTPLVEDVSDSDTYEELDAEDETWQTDEEYDILDASDEEAPVAKK
ncbi:hypothetical protein EJ06DRAFT_303500 [Trichodelitschia bisporula]|uniref:ZZ-type domain-containing protein n=1 Tax=Trichodelitschia bisporula TaxID=703511 RepID=A0A6G1I6Y2_9PEZI|nr:hypothetical protein EJ06DRAFT_303500 [Trichodelitschia bisporula]